MCLTLDEQPVVDHRLNVGVEESGDVVAHLQVGDVDERAGGGSQRFLTQDAHDQLPVLHYDLCEWVEYEVTRLVINHHFWSTHHQPILYLGVARWDVFVRAAVFIVRMSAVCADHINVSRND